MCDLQRVTPIKYVLIGVWLALVIAVSLAIYFQDRFLLIENKYIAYLDDRNGPVLSRSEGLVRWRDLIDKQGVHDGDTLSTGESSSARVRFDRDRAVYLGEDTQVKITAIGSERGTAFVIKLLRGSAVPQINEKCAQCPPLILRAGEESFTISAGKKVAVFKAQGSKEVKKFQTKPITNNADFQEIVAAIKPAVAAIAPAPPPPVPVDVALTTVFLRPEPAQRPPPAAPPPPRPVPAPAPAPVPAPAPAPAVLPIEAVKMEAKPAENGMEYWTMRPLDSILDQYVDFPVSVPESVRADSSLALRPFIEISGNGQTEQIFANQATDLTVRVPLKSIKNVSASKMVGGVKKYLFSARAGVEIMRGSARSKFLSEGSVVTQIVSLGEVPVGQLSVGLSDFNPKSENLSSVWLTKKDEIDLADAKISVFIAKISDYGKLAPLVRGTSKVALDRRSPIGSDGFFVVRDDEIVAQISGPNLNKQNIDKIMALLGGEFVFKGQRTAYHDVQGFGQGKQGDPLWSLISKGHVLYILKRGTLYPVSHEFLKTSAEVTSFIGNQAQAIFVKKVEIVSHK